MEKEEQLIEEITHIEGKICKYKIGKLLKGRLILVLHFSEHYLSKLKDLLLTTHAVDGDI